VGEILEEVGEILE
jgi:hypothetical protein